MKLRLLITNRVVLGLAFFVIAVGLWVFKYKPQYRPLYQEGVAAYQRGDYPAAFASLERAYAIAPNSVDVILMMGWASLKLNRYEDARMYFDRVLKIDSRVEEARIGASFVALETGRGSLDYDLINEVISQRRDDPNLLILAAGALSSEGKQYEAAAIYRDLRGHSSYGHSASAALDDLFGLRGMDDTPSFDPPAFRRPDSLRVRYRAAEGALWQLRGNQWQKHYVVGVNLSPGAPGYYPSAGPGDGGVYLAWLQQTAALNANVVHVYTLLPPVFYRAYARYAQTAPQLKLYQHVWVDEPPGSDLYDPQFVEEMRAKIRHTIDAIHGRGAVPTRPRRPGGIYQVNIADHVGALLLGGDVDPVVVQQTNINNLGKSEHKGKYVSVGKANPSEVWFAEMLDYMVAYETETYNAQRPVGLSTWAPLDPLTHPSESTGTRNDIVSLDDAKLRASSDFHAGLFVAYSVFPYYPDFLMDEARYLSARDGEGSNPFYGYLLDLRRRSPHPLLVTEYGIPNSIGISRFHPLGWHQGGQTEEQQAQVLARFTRSIRQAGCAGGIVHELFDQWHKTNWLTRDFQRPADRATFWLNDLTPEERYGLIGFRTSKWKLFAGSEADWTQERTIYQPSAASSTFDPAQNVRSVQVSSDEGYLYLRLKLQCARCGAQGPRAPAGESDLAYVVALNTLSGKAGLRALPFGNLALESGANFLLYLGRPGDAKLLIASNYYPYEVETRSQGPARSEFRYRRRFVPSLESSGAFLDMEVETRAARFGRNGVFYPAQRYNRSVLRHGNGDPEAKDYDSLAEWYLNPRTDTILARISWGKLLIADPSGLQAFYGFSERLDPQVATTPGIDVAVFTLQAAGSPAQLQDDRLLSSFPPVSQGVVRSPQRYAWKPWNSLSPQPYHKRAYYALQKEFAAQAGAAAQPGAAGAAQPARPAGPGRRAAR